MAREYLKSAVSQTLGDLRQSRQTVSELIQKVREGGDEAILELTEKFNGIKQKSLIISKDEIMQAKKEIPRTLKEDMDAQLTAYSFHRLNRNCARRKDTYAQTG